LVAEAAQGERQGQRKALGQLLTQYLPALRAHLIHGKGFQPDVADDLVQEFVLSKILQKDLIAQANQQLGKFRTFLLTALDRFLINRARDARAKKRCPHDGVQREIAAQAECRQAGQEPSRVFDRAWAHRVIRAGLDRMRLECEAAGRPDVWGLFECRVVGPILEGVPLPHYRQLVERFKLQSPRQAMNLFITAKRMYARCLRSVIAEYAGTEQEIQTELVDLWNVLAQG
jgi:RNA polymerase sigma-70 factor (ECF subfamily)